ncbi:hypothetical protein V865_003032 [Kwoniella europaea PYCC6329]|uniref:Uncharacterized protein n=1 Tax=Kwoniella europaea PYCC6329 TaxID=1423913 RepID=A0AAX4KEG0_9TREE
MAALPYFDTIVEAARPNRTSLPVSFGRSNLSDPFGIRAAERELNNLFGSIPGLGPSGSFRPNREANRAFGNHFGQFGVRVPNSSNPPGQSKRTTASSNTKINTTSGTGTEGRRARDEIVYPEWWTNGSPEPSEGVVLHADSSGSKDTEVLTY